MTAGATGRHTVGMFEVGYGCISGQELRLLPMNPFYSRLSQMSVDNIGKMAHDSHLKEGGFMTCLVNTGIAAG